MATFQFNVDEQGSPYGSDHTQCRQIVYGTAQIQPDTPGGTTSTYVLGGIRAVFVPAEPIKATTFTPSWVEMQSLKSHNQYLWIPGAVVTNLAVAANVLTVTANNNLAVGDRLRLDIMTGPAAARALNLYNLVVATASATQFTASLGVANITSAAVTGLATPTRYYTPAPTQPGQSNPLVPSPQGNIMILAAGTEISAGSIATTVTGDVVFYRAEFIRSYN